MTRNTTGHIHAQTPSPVKYAAGRSFQRVPALITEITVQTAFTASIWTINQGTGSQNAMDVWSRSVYKKEKTENGRSYTAVSDAAKSVPTVWLQMIIR